MKAVLSYWCIMVTPVLVMGMDPEIPDKKAEMQQIALLARVCFPDAKQLAKHERDGVLTALAELYAIGNVQLIRTMQQGKIEEHDKKQLQARVKRIMSDIDSDAFHFRREKQEQEQEQAVNRYLIKLGLIALAACMVVHSMWEYCIGVERVGVEDAFFS